MMARGYVSVPLAHAMVVTEIANRNEQSSSGDIMRGILGGDPAPEGGITADAVGWHTVPHSPSMAMLNAAVDHTGAGSDMDWNGLSPQSLFQRAWFAMLAAAPTHPAPEGAGERMDGNRPLPFDRDELGRMVREAWVRWAKTQPAPKPSWLVPYDELAEPDKEADRQIGEAIARWTLIGDASRFALEGAGDTETGEPTS